MEAIEKILNKIFIKNGKANIFYYLTAFFCVFGLIFYFIKFIFKRSKKNEKNRM